MNFAVKVFIFALVLEVLVTCTAQRKCKPVRRFTRRNLLAIRKECIKVANKLRKDVIGEGFELKWDMKLQMKARRFRPKNDAEGNLVKTEDVIVWRTRNIKECDVRNYVQKAGENCWKDSLLDGKSCSVGAELINKKFTQMGCAVKRDRFKSTAHVVLFLGIKPDKDFTSEEALEKIKNECLDVANKIRKDTIGEGSELEWDPQLASAAIELKYQDDLQNGIVWRSFNRREPDVKNYVQKAGEKCWKNSLPENDKTCKRTADLTDAKFTKFGCAVKQNRMLTNVVALVSES